ncbi:MAG TPA: cytochrome c biogenesis protein CcsA [Verrucomicrobiae bacterium]|nr:cytochrome c biogenesis protein CcsA [Verrucomicrobiae bacterium]
MSSWETIFFCISLGIYSLACGGYVYSLVFKARRFMEKMALLVPLGFVAHTVAIAARYAAQGHLPWSGDYENSLMGGWFIVAGTIFVGWRSRDRQGLATVTLPFVITMMGFGVMRNPLLTPMAASLKTFWLYVHVYFAWLCFGAYTLAMAAGVLYLLKLRAVRQGSVNSAFDEFPALERLDELIFSYVVFGFIMDSMMLVAGSMWAKDLWGSYWSWDPVETWSLVSYLIYGVAIHLRLTMGWRGTKLAWLAIAALVTVIISFFGVNLMVNTSLHIFNVQ